MVTDAGYRHQSEEQLLPGELLYTAIYEGESGQKHVLRTPSNISVAYDGDINRDENKNAAAALTADAFLLITLGPLALNERISNWQRLPDSSESRNQYYRINGQLHPGIGLSDNDYITLWVDNKLTSPIAFTLLWMALMPPEELMLIPHF